MQEIESAFGGLFHFNCFLLKVVKIFQISETFDWNMKRGFLSNEDILQTKNYVTDNQRLFIVSSVLHRIMNEKAKLSSFHYSVSHTRNNKKELIIWLIC